MKALTSKTKFRDFLNNFESEKAANKINENTNVLVYSTKRHARFEPNFMLVGGLADRLKGVVTAYLLSVYARRAFAIEWLNPCSLEPALSHNNCDWRPTTWAMPLLAPRTVKHADLIDQAQLLETMPPYEILRLAVSEDQISYLNANIFSHSLCHKMFPGFSPTEVFKEAFETLFKFTVPPAYLPLWNRVEDARSRKGSLIGVHWRTGEGNGWDDPVMGNWLEAEKAIEQAVEDACQHKGFTNPAVYFATDSAKAKEIIQTRSWPFEVLVAQQDAIHIDRSNVNSRDGFDFALVEFMILRSCDFIYGGAGQYWMTAALAGDKACERISIVS